MNGWIAGRRHLNLKLITMSLCLTIFGKRDQIFHGYLKCWSNRKAERLLLDIARLYLTTYPAAGLPDASINCPLPPPLHSLDAWRRARATKDTKSCRLIKGNLPSLYITFYCATTNPQPPWASPAIPATGPSSTKTPSNSITNTPPLTNGVRDAQKLLILSGQKNSILPIRPNITDVVFAMQEIDLIFVCAEISMSI